MYEETININTISEIRSRVTTYLGVNAIDKITEILVALKERSITRVLVVSGAHSYKKSGAWDHVEPAMKDNGISYELYNGVTPNPSVDEVDAAVSTGKSFGAQAVIGIGGGSPIDVAKSTAALCASDGQTGRDLYEYTFTPRQALPIIAINLTHGTGTEVNRFAVASIPEKEFKPAIAYDILYPLFSIDDPALMLTLSREQTLYVSIDAVNHAIEAATTTTSTPYSIFTAKETIRLVAKYLPIALDDPQNLNARYFLTYAAMLAGISFDNGLLHCTHALEHPLSAVKPEVIHGYGLALLLPAMLRHIYPAKGRIIADVLSPIVPDLTGTEDEGISAASGMRQWFSNLGVPMGLKNAGFVESDIYTLADLVSKTPSLGMLLSLTPVKSDRTSIESIYSESM